MSSISPSTSTGAALPSSASLRHREALLKTSILRGDAGMDVTENHDIAEKVIHEGGGVFDTEQKNETAQEDIRLRITEEGREIVEILLPEKMGWSQLRFKNLHDSFKKEAKFRQSSIAFQICLFIFLTENLVTAIGNLAFLTSHDDRAKADQFAIAITSMEVVAAASTFNKNPNEVERDRAFSIGRRGLIGVLVAIVSLLNNDSYAGAITCLGIVFEACYGVLAFQTDVTLDWAISCGLIFKQVFMAISYFAYTDRDLPGRRIYEQTGGAFSALTAVAIFTPFVASIVYGQEVEKGV
ncbi:hypothetical protein GALMADRAFT_209974 [Galerina marginata CBS 339.88]|uniref:Uncharacterized protein n=1 Tax=Galerina marginata (strain CBS 339.88) TaxID=685588 RepID=A0A067TFE4_GALM3|nr:hypothetical protein GALMADRAFT_209974 [Galerina marginata CBS 339.88]